MARCPVNARIAMLVSGLVVVAPGVAAVPAGQFTIDACALLRPAEIQRVIGTQVSAGVRRDFGLETNGAYSSSCVWLLGVQEAAPSGPSLDLAGRSYVILNAMQWPAGTGRARSFLDSFHEAKAGGVLAGELTPKKIGDDALWWGDGLAVVRRDTSFGLSVHFAAGRREAPGASEEQLAAHVLRRVDERDAGPAR